MEITESYCVNCEPAMRGCDVCHNRSVTRRVCDRCGSEAKYRIQGEDICDDCMKGFILDDMKDCSTDELIELYDPQNMLDIERLEE